jgi:hypothetical protein
MAQHEALAKATVHLTLPLNSRCDIICILPYLHAHATPCGSRRWFRPDHLLLRHSVVTL